MTETSEPLLRLRDVEVGYSGRAILPALSLTIRPGDSWVLLGRNGGGKSTVLKTLLGLLPPVRGVVRWAQGTALSYVPQRGDYDLSVPARVIDFVAGGLDRGWSFLWPGLAWSSRDRVLDAMAQVQVEDLATQRFAELSEGQKQRVLMARALVSQPDIVILDEPTSAMDVVAEAELFRLLGDLRRRAGLTFIVASHQLTLAPKLATLALLVDRDSQLVSIGAVDDVLNSAAFTARFGAPGPRGHDAH